jgi:hypothetical protein
MHERSWTELGTNQETNSGGVCSRSCEAAGRGAKGERIVPLSCSWFLRSFLYFLCVLLFNGFAFIRVVCVFRGSSVHPPVFPPFLPFPAPPFIFSSFVP